MTGTQQDGRRPAWLQAVVRHPYITAFNLICGVVGVIGALHYLPADWSLWRRVASGAFAGGSIGLFITANRMLGAWR